MLDITKPWRCQDNFFDGIFTEHVIEHITYSEAVHVMKEAKRTLKPGSWIRISVPAIERCLKLYRQIKTEGPTAEFPEAALCISHLTQMHFHRSVWDAHLMMRLLSETGFVDVQEREFREGADKRLLKDGESKRHESLYVEARKPNAGE
jgi:predicted SAM-dependent methyltransferase